MTDETAFHAAAEALGEIGSARQLRDEMLRWAPQFHRDLFEKKIVAGPRPELGMQLSIVPGKSGFAVKKGGSYFVSIGNETESAEKRFTLAHELGHVLLDSVDRSRVRLSRAEEERLCDRFASRVIAPLEKVEAYQRRVGQPESLADLERFIDEFGLTQRVALIVIDSVLPRRWPVAFVLASWRAHPQRQVMGIRVDSAAADSRLHFPHDTRVSTLGFAKLEAWALKREFGSVRKGSDRAEVPSRGGLIPGWSGSSAWSAKTQYAPGSKAPERRPAVLCCVGVDAFASMPARPRPRSRGRRTLPPISRRPGQMSL